MTDELARLAARVERDPFFLGWALRIYAESEGLDEAGLAARLGCPASLLPKVKLCRCPSPSPPAFQADITAIAGRFGLRADVLANIVRHAEALEALRRAGRVGSLWAARGLIQPDWPGPAAAARPASPMGSEPAEGSEESGGAGSSGLERAPDSAAAPDQTEETDR
ncbi:MAG TPA: hypothetical protein VFF52_22735 [Isosphaeraceae bacterium]|nr:hypothetical protein [Isosphaeraceae bacterium]